MDRDDNGQPNQSSEPLTDKKPRTAYPFCYWRNIITSMLVHGIDPNMSDLARYIRSERGPLPSVVSEYLADLVERRDKRKRRVRFEIYRKRQLAVRMLGYQHDEFKESGEPDPFTAAAEIVSKEWDTSSRSLTRWASASKRKT